MDGEGQLRGLQRILAREVHVSDLLQHLTDLDPAPWKTLVGFVPVTAGRERKLGKLNADEKVKGSVDLLLSGEGAREVAIEVKLGHRFSADQQTRYERSTTGGLVLAGLASDRSLVSSAPRWEYLSLADVFQAWVGASSHEAAVLSLAASRAIREWDTSIDAVFKPEGGGKPLISVREKFLAVVIARRIADELERRGLTSYAGVSSGSGGLAIAQAWVPIREDPDRCVTAEIRWHEGMQAGELRLGIDFSLPESREARAEAWALVKAMDGTIRIDTLRAQLAQSHPRLDQLLVRSDAGRKPAEKEDIWLKVVERGLWSETNPDGVKGGRSQSSPGFVGDGTQRFEAVSKLDYSTATATDLIELIEASLEYLRTRLPEGYA